MTAMVAGGQRKIMLQKAGTRLEIAVVGHEAVGLPMVTDSFPTDGTGTRKYASWDDVNVVAHGLLQLGQGLKEHVDKTKVQMRDIDAKLKAFNNTLAALERRQQEEALRLMERTEAEQMRRRNEEIQARVIRLEEKVEGALTEPQLDSNHSKNSVTPSVQRILMAQSGRIDQLVKKIQQQQEKLEKQSMHLQALQSKLAKKRVKSHRRRDEEAVLRALNDDKPGLSRSCHDFFLRGERVSGIYWIQPENSQPFIVLCEMTAEGGWTVIQKRLDGSQNFNQLWREYKNGFGTLTGELAARSGEFWLGLEKIHTLSNQGQSVLQVEVTDWTGQTQAARYSVQVDGEEKKFALHLQPESSSGIQTGSTGVLFSTPDRDNDLAAEVDCAQKLSGGWWFTDCGASNLNGKYPRRHRSTTQEMFWENRSLTATLLKIGPAAMQQ
ncbi:angiopoietin-related protein 4-like [Neosynchiropus ocellatus]